MKHLNKFYVVIMIVMGFSSHAQDRNNPWAISAGINAVDTRTSALQDKNHFDSFFKVKEDWNIFPSAYISLSRYLGSNFSVGVQGSFNKITKFVQDGSPVFDDLTVINPGDLKYYAFDANIKYSFMEVINSKVVEPTLNVGTGFTFLGDNSFGTVNGGVGLNFWFTERFGLSLGMNYKKSLSQNRTDGIEGSGLPVAPSHFQHTIGLTYKFGGKDTDKDGIYDRFDACPEVPGLKEFNGCPDKDGDGVIDSEDNCPDVAGPKELGGCPDTDGDGILDKDDACPNVKGSKALKGCPDSDNDGVADKDDKCPTVAGPIENAGCPWPDTDGDGTVDKDDVCPEQAGPASNNGCPEITEEAIFGVKSQARFIYFNFDSATLKKGDTPKRIDAMSFVINNYPNNEFLIEGHTDSVGQRDVNQKLSQERADAVRNALIAKGFPADKIKAIGYGESKPVSTNKTKEGRALNRRTEIKLVK